MLPYLHDIGVFNYPPISCEHHVNVYNVGFKLT